MSEVTEMNEHFCDDKPQYEEGFCNYCGAEEHECSEYKCWIK
jgi:hypothetical protein